MAEQTKMTFGQACVRGLSLTVGNPGALLLGTLSESGISILTTCIQTAAVLVAVFLALGSGDGILETALSWKNVFPLVGASCAVLALSLCLRGLWTGAAVRRFSSRLETKRDASGAGLPAEPIEPIALEGTAAFPRVAFFSAVFLPVLLAALLVGATGIGGALLIAWEMLTGALKSKWLAAFAIALGTTLALFVNKGAWMLFKAGLVRIASSDEPPLEALLSGFRLLARRPFFFIGLFMLFAAAESVALWMADASGAGFATTQETIQRLPTAFVIFLFLVSSVIAAAALVFVNAAEYGALTALSMEEQGRFVVEKKPEKKPMPVHAPEKPMPSAAVRMPVNAVPGKAAGSDGEIVGTVLATSVVPSTSVPAGNSPVLSRNCDDEEIVGTVLAPPPSAAASAAAEPADASEPGPVKTAEPAELTAPAATEEVSVPSSETEPVQSAPDAAAPVPTAASPDMACAESSERRPEG